MWIKAPRTTLVRLPMGLFARTLPRPPLSRAQRKATGGKLMLARCGGVLSSTTSQRRRRHRPTICRAKTAMKTSPPLPRLLESQAETESSAILMIVKPEAVVFFEQTHHTVRLVRPQPPLVGQRARVHRTRPPCRTTTRNPSDLLRARQMSRCIARVMAWDRLFIRTTLISTNTASPMTMQNTYRTTSSAQATKRGCVRAVMELSRCRQGSWAPGMVFSCPSA